MKSFITNYDNWSDSILSPKQLKEINKRTPDNEVENRTDEAGFTFKSVNVGYIRKQLLKIFGFNYDFQILSYNHVAQTNEVVVHGRLTIRLEKGTIIREQFGRSYISSKQVNSGGKISYKPTNIGDSYKAASSDALKKCASEIGICWDIYASEPIRPTAKEVVTDNHKESERLQIALEGCSTIAEVRQIEDVFLSQAIEPNDNDIALIYKHSKRVINNVE